MKRTMHIGLIGLIMGLLIVTTGCQDNMQRETKSPRWKTMRPVRHAFYVSPDGCDKNPGTEAKPFATIARAQDALRRMIHRGAKGEMTVWIAGGRYELTEPLQFDQRDSGSGKVKVIYRAVKGQSPVISGGRMITGWTKGPDGLWQAQIDDVAEGWWRFRQLFADGKRLPRAKYPNDDFLDLKKINEPDPWNVRQTFEFNTTLPFGNLSQRDTEAVFLYLWSSSRNWLRNSDANTIETDFPVGFRGAPLCQPNIAWTRVFFEHAKVFIDENGEWYLDRDTGTVYLKLAEGQNPNEMEMIAPVIDQLVIVKGTSNRPIRNLYFVGLTFEHTSWFLPLAGYHGLQAASHGKTYMTDPTYMLPSVVYFEYARKCGVKMCRIAHAGANALSFGAGCRDNIAIGCQITDIGANGIIMGYQHRADDIPRRFFETDWKDPDDAPMRNQVSHNHICQCGQIHFGAVGYYERFSTGCTFSHNEIHDMPYTGVSIGFTWNHLPSTQHHSTVEYNKIYDVMKLMYDGGGIYTLGYQPGSVVRNNLIKDVHNGHGLYTDEGSSRILFENNIVIRAGVHGYQHHYGHSNVLRNNILYKSITHPVRHAKEQGRASFTFEHNIIVLDKNRPYSPTDHHFKQPDNEGINVLREDIVIDRKASFNHNLYWQVQNEPLKFVDMTLQQWQDTGQDTDSVVADPMFVDAENGDLGLKKGSPALKIGIQSIDMSNVGPNKKYKLDCGD